MDNLELQSIINIAVMLTQFFLKYLTMMMIFLVILLTLTLIHNLFVQRKALSGMKSEENFVTRTSFSEWRKCIKRYKNYAIIPYILFLIVFIAGFYFVEVYLILASIAFFFWKQISLFWPSTFVFTRSGIYFWDPFIMSMRKNYPPRVLWSEIRTIHYDSTIKHLVIQTDYEVIHYPIKEVESIKLREWLSNNFFGRFISNEYANYKKQ